MTTQTQRVTVLTRLDQICYNRITSPDFAAPPTIKQKIIAALNHMRGTAQ